MNVQQYRHREWHPFELSREKIKSLHQLFEMILTLHQSKEVSSKVNESRNNTISCSPSNHRFHNLDFDQQMGWSNCRRFDA